VVKFAEDHQLPGDFVSETDYQEHMPTHKSWTGLPYILKVSARLFLMRGLAKINCKFCLKAKHAITIQLPTPAVGVALPAFAERPAPASNRSISLARRALSSKPAASCCSDRQMGQKDGRTPAVT